MTAKTEAGRPKTYECSKCGGAGHNAQRCFAVRAYSPPPIIGRACGKCGAHGHDGRKCFAVTSPEGPRALKNQCTYCMGFGHGSHRCPQKRVRACETCGVEIGHGARKQCVTCYRETVQRAMRVCIGCGHQFRPTRSDSQVCIGSVECLRLAKVKAQAGRFDSLQGMTFGMWTVVEHSKAKRCVVECRCGYPNVLNPQALKTGKSAACIRCTAQASRLELTEEERQRREVAAANAQYEATSSRLGRRTTPEGRKWKYGRRAQIRDAIIAIKSAPCMDCGGRFHHVAMDFDHRPEENKTGEVSYLARSATLEALLAEIAKCDLVCANCHRVRTYGRSSEVAKRACEAAQQNQQVA